MPRAFACFEGTSGEGEGRHTTRARESSRGGHGLGRLGEEAAASHLVASGLRVLERRFRTRAGEIDLVAEDGPVVVFVEVKTRRTAAYGRPAEAVSRIKRARLARVALAFLHARGWHERTCRFDVVEIVRGDGRPERIEHIRDAFRVGDRG